MSLTKENVETNERAFDVGAVFRDIARMDESQLTSYTRRSFTNDPDYDFLPYPFWHHYFNMKKQGPSYDGREAPSPAIFLSELHDIIGITYQGRYIVRGGHPDFEYRPRYRKVLSELLDQCLTIETGPADGDKLLAINTIGAVERLGQVEIQYQNTDVINPQSEAYLDKLRQDLDILNQERHSLTEKAQRIIDGGVFGKFDDSEIHN